MGLVHRVLWIFRHELVHSDCRTGGHPVEKPLMDNTVPRPFGPLTAVCCPVMNGWREGRRNRRRSVVPTTKISEEGWGLVLLRKRPACAFMLSGWICARRAFAVSWTSVSGAGRVSGTRGGCHEGRSAARVAHHSIGDAMSITLATDYSQAAPAEISGVSLLLVPSSAGDNRPYISNLAEKLADAPTPIHPTGGER